VEEEEGKGSWRKKTAAGAPLGSGAGFAADKARCIVVTVPVGGERTWRALQWREAFLNHRSFRNLLVQGEENINFLIL
jgi:hypothetical protein